MSMTVERLCELAARSRVLSPAVVRAVRRRWEREGGADAADVGRFARWLVAAHFLTEYQVRRLLRGRTDCLFLGKYKILRRLAGGPITRTYKALQPDGQVVALKVLPPRRAADRVLRACFRHEARAALHLRHPNLVRVRRVRQVHGVYFVVMEYLPGETLAAVLRRRGRLSPGAALRLALQALRALQYIHERGQVHGGVEPADVMLVAAATAAGTDTTRGRTVKLLGAGRGPSRLVELARTKAALRGEAGVALPAAADYLAPEQLLNPRGADIRADLYALGCVLYHCLTGRPPFPSGSAVAEMIRHAIETPRPLRELDPTLPPALQPVMDRLLAKNPADRYPTPAAAAQALAEAWRQGRPHKQASA